MPVVLHWEGVLWFYSLDKEWHFCREDPYWYSLLDNKYPKSWNLKFFRTAILPEIIGRFYSRPAEVHSMDTSLTPATKNGLQITENQHPSISTELMYCYCRGPEEGEMVACDNSQCPYTWFHLSCLGLKSPPSSRTWYCPDCRKLPEFSRKKRKTIAHA